MKRVLVLLLILGFVSSANAVIVTFQSPGLHPAPYWAGYPPQTYGVYCGQIVTVQIVADTAITSSYTLSITETTNSAVGHSTALGVGVLNAGFDSDVRPGTLRNAMTNFPTSATQRYMLIDRISAGINAAPPIPAGAVLYQFDLLIPAAIVFGDTFTITATTGQPVISPPPGGYSHQVDYVTVATTNTLFLGEVPEPMAVSLLAFGGLFLRRRK